MPDIDATLAIQRSGRRPAQMGGTPHSVRYAAGCGQRDTAQCSLSGWSSPGYRTLCGISAAPACASWGVVCLRGNRGARRRAHCRTSCSVPLGAGTPLGYRILCGAPPRGTLTYSGTPIGQHRAKRWSNILPEVRCCPATLGFGSSRLDETAPDAGQIWADYGHLGAAFDQIGTDVDHARADFDTSTPSVNFLDSDLTRPEIG